MSAASGSPSDFGVTKVLNARLASLACLVIIVPFVLLRFEMLQFQC